MEAPLPPRDPDRADGRDDARAEGLDDDARTPSPLAVSVLALLAEAPATQAALREQLTSRRQDRLVAWDDGALDEAVAEVRGHGWATGATALELTEAGHDALIAWTAAALAAHDPERPAFDLALLTAPAVSPDIARAALTRRLAALDAATGELTTRIRTAARRGLSEAYGLQADYRRALLMAEFRWLSRLLERMDSGELSWTAGEAPTTTPEGA